VEVAEMYTGDEYEFTLRECRTGEIIDDVRTFRSEIGILFRDSFNSRVLDKAFADANVVFTPLFDAQVHVFVGEHHPLAKAKILTLDDLENYPRYSFEQGTENSFYYAEEPFNQIPHKKEIRFSDRGTLTNLLTNHIGYTLSTGVLSSEMHTGIVSIPLDTRGLPGSNGTMQVGYIIHSQMKRSPLLEDYISMLENVMRDNPFVHPYKH
ncbi:MAG: LysR family transcriptional regulator substrate-binding protein, partial [Ellagibacter isourolithinifaciens]|nr:LysR family transcriptional regulator substrate-binding protein [Ellagibacter isourolithinifaciens]